MVYYFAYGSNMNLEQIRERTQNSNLQPSFIGYMKDKKLIFPRESKITWEGGVASYDHSDGDNLWGAVFLLTDEELKKIDPFEGYHGYGKSNAYEKIENEEIIKENGKSIKITTYVANKVGNFLPSKKYRDWIIKGAKECKLPEEYIERLNEIQTK